MESQIFCPPIFAGKSDDIESSAGKQRPRLAKKTKNSSAPVVKPAGLARIILQLSREESISRRCGDRRRHKSTNQEPVTSRKNTVLGMYRIRCLRLAGNRNRQEQDCSQISHESHCAQLIRIPQLVLIP